MRFRSPFLDFRKSTRKARTLICEKMSMWAALLVICSLFEVGTAWGPTLVTKVGQVASGDTLSWVGAGAQVVVINATVLEPNLEESVLAVSSNISDDTKVSSLGISSDGMSSLVTTGSDDIRLLSLVGNEGGDLELEVSSSLAISTGLVLKVGRILDAIQYNNNDVYFLATNYEDSNLGHVVALTTGSGDIEVITSIDLLGVTNIADIQVTEDLSILYVSSDSGVIKLKFDYSENNGVFTYLAKMDGPSGDGMALSNDDGYAFLAAQDNGLVVMDLTANNECGQANASGWAGGAGYSANDGSLALIAADPGLYGFSVVDPTNPELNWVCFMANAGIGWNVDVRSCYAYVSDYDGGLQVVQFCDNSVNNSIESFAPIIVAHFGSGTIQTCESLL